MRGFQHRALTLAARPRIPQDRLARGRGTRRASSVAPILVGQGPPRVEQRGAHGALDQGVKLVSGQPRLDRL